MPAVYDAVSDETIQVEDCPLNAVAFQAFARGVWYVVRHRLALPFVSPDFARNPDGAVVGTMLQGARIANHLVTLPIASRDDLNGALVHFADQLLETGCRDFCRLALPPGCYHAARLQCPDDAFSVRVVTAWGGRDGWITQLAVLLATGGPRG